MKKEARRLAERRLHFLNARRTRIVIDADTHPSYCRSLANGLRERYEASPDYYHGRPVDVTDLLREMDLAGVDMALAWQNPATTVYGSDSGENFEALLRANQAIYHMAVEYPERVFPAGWTDPKALGVDRALELVDICVSDFGFAIIKMNPAQNAYPIDDPDVFRVVDRILERGAYPAFHYGADTPFTPPEGLERIARHCRPHPVIAVHMGGGGAGYVQGEDTYLKTRELGLREPNLFFILSARRDTHTESDLIRFRMAGEPFWNNLAWASDAPYGRIAFNVGGYRQMFVALRRGEGYPDPRLRANPRLFDETAERDLMGGNMARLGVQAYTRLLEANRA